MAVLARYKLISTLFVSLALLYLAQIVFAAPDPDTLERFGITATQLVLLTLTVVLPYMAIWFVALVGYLRLKNYVAAIAGSRDGGAWDEISKGVLLLTLWLPIPTVADGYFEQYYQANPDATATLVILYNYLHIVILFPAFLFIYRGSAKLLGVVTRPLVARSQHFILAYLAFAAGYAYLVFHDPNRRLPVSESSPATNYLPDWLILLTLVIPRLIMWFLGAQAVFNILAYRQKVRGSIYKAGLTHLALGLAWVVIAVIMLRGLQSLSATLDSLGLAPLLVLVYILLIVIGVGYFLISKGAKKLQKIEEV